MNKILIIGAGYVGMSNGVYLSKKNDVIFYDIDKEKNKLINNNLNYINDPSIKKYIADNKLKLKTMNLNDALIDRNYIFICVPTDYDENTKCLNTTLIESVSVPVTCYHFIYLNGDNTCNESICHSENQIREEFNYLKSNNYFTLTTTELGKFIDGKIRLPEKSILVTIDDGARAWNFVPILEEYGINATLFLVSSWYDLEQFKSPYMGNYGEQYDCTNIIIQ